MATTRDIRRLAFQALYQLDARAGEEPAGVLEAMTNMEEEEQTADFTASERRKAFALALEAYNHRASADAFLLETAPAWPSHRQAAVDRAILRLAYHEMTTGAVPPKVGVNEAVELAKVFSTEKSASFVNGVLDKLLKSVLQTPDDSTSPDADSPPQVQVSLRDGANNNGAAAPEQSGL